MITKLREYYNHINNPYDILRLLINIAFGLVVLFGIYISFKMNGTGRSLWYDEAALAMSMTQRSFGNLTSTGLDNCQSAPVVWLYLVKIIISICGNSEYTLRLMSVISYIGVVLSSFFVFSKILKVRIPSAYTAFVAMIPLFVRYSNVFKPYEFDALCVLLVIISYFLYRERKINTITFSIIWALLIWCSNPSCFFEGGFILAYLIEILMSKDWKKLRDIVLVAIAMLISFVSYYFYWLRQSVGYMQDYWEGAQFPLIPRSMEDIKLIIEDTKYIYSAFEKVRLFVFILSCIAFVISIIKKNHILIGIHLGFLITLFASFIGFFPISDRLWVFAYPLIGILAMMGIEYVCELLHTTFIKNDISRFVSLFIAAALVLLLIILGRGWRYLYSFNHYWLREELNYELDYVQNNISSDESIFIASNACLGYQYKTDYGRKSIFTNDTYMSSFDCEEDARQIALLDKCYILLSHYDIADESEPCYQMLQSLSDGGYVQLVAYDHMTPVYYYCSSPDDIKAEVNADEVWY